MKIIHPSHIQGTIQAPASKSMMQRAIAIATLAHGTSTLHGYTPSNDSDAALKIAHNLGATVTQENTVITIQGGLQPRSTILNCGEAGLGIRMFTPIASLWHKPIELHGEGSLTTRPIDSLIQPLTDLGVHITTNNGFVPVQVCGPMQGGTATVDGSLSSQILTGLLIASPLAQKDTIFTVHKLQSKPYIDMTIQIMQDFGITVSHTNYETFSIACNQSYTPQNYVVEGDWSGASFHLVAGAIAGTITITNVRNDSKQADMALVEALRLAGAKIKLHNNSITISKQELNAFHFDATDCPDLFPPLVSLAAHCKGVTTIKGVNRLQHKESNRALVLQTEFAKLGTKIILDADIMYIHGGTLTGGRIHANNDHRIAMAGAVAALLAKQPIEIENPECVAKSYPHFWEDFAQICK